VINLANNSVAATVAVGTAPAGSVVDTATDTVYVANAMDNTLSAINGSTNTVVGTIPVGSHPVAIAIDPVTSTLYVSDLFGAAVSVVSESLGAVIATVDLGARYEPAAIAVDPSLGTVYAGIDDEIPYVAVINAGSNTLTTVESVGDSQNGAAQADGVAVDPSTHEVFVSTGDITGGTSHAAAIITPDFANPPGAPTIGAASAGNGNATVAFSPPASDGGQNISSYIAIATDVTNPSRGGQTASGTESPIIIAGLTNGDTYTFTVTATNYAPGLPSGSSQAVVPVVGPKVTAISPSSGSTAGGNTVTITGTGFTGATKVDLGTVAATSFTVVSSTEITFVAPKAGAGTHNITVTTPAGTSKGVGADLYTDVS
jgi:YVTN family beta-propeller protein